jgi:iron complex outermembrane recepter protein
MNKYVPMTATVKAVALTFGAMAVSSSAFAQQNNEPQKQERIEVTGSSIKRIDAETALPVTIIRRADIERTGAATVSDLVEKISANNGQGYALSAALGDGARPGFSGASLRALGSNNTLVLLNGRRLAIYAFDGGAVSLNDIPLSVVERVEILRDGASSVYGTDAVAGVINLITRSDFNGGELGVLVDAPQEKGGRITQIRGTAGFGDLGKDGFNVMLNIGRTEVQGIKAADREYAKTAFLPAAGIDRTSANAYPANIFVPGVGLRSPSAPFYARPAGSPASPGTIPANAAIAPNRVPGGSIYGCLQPVSYGRTDAERQCRFDYASVIDIFPEASRDNFFARGTLALGTSNKLTGEFARSDNTAVFRISPTPASEATTIAGDPVLLPTTSKYYPTAWVAANAPSLVGQPLNLYWRSVEAGPRANQVKSTQDRLVLDLTGDFGGWDYNIGYMNAKSKATESYVGGYLSEQRTIRGFASGNVNPFGLNDATGLGVIQGMQILEDVRIATSQVSIFNAKASRELAQLPAGPLGFAAGVERRAEKYGDNPLAILNTGDVIGGGGTQLPVKGNRTVSALFGEVALPIVKGLESQLSLRHDRYTDFGSTTNPKAALRWQPNKEFLVRGSYGTGFRAPTLPDMFSQLTQTNTGGAYDDPFYLKGKESAPGRNDGCDNVFDGKYCGAQLTVRQGGAIAGGVALKPEKSKNITAGVVFEPTRNLSITVDAFRIYQEDLIGLLNADVILDDFINNFNPATGTSTSRYASKVSKKRDVSAGTDVIDSITTTFDNFGEQVTRGVDVQVKWKLPTTTLGGFTFNWDIAYIDSVKTRDPGEGNPWSQNLVGSYIRNGAVLRVKQRAELVWNRGSWEAALAYNWQSGYNDQEPFSALTGAGLAPRKVSEYQTADFTAKYRGIKNLELTLGIFNLTNKNPPFSQQGDFFQVGYDPSNTSPRGRSIAVGAKYKFW